MSRKLLLSSIAIAATATMLGVGTYAKFSDSEKCRTTTVTAGTMDLKWASGTTTSAVHPDHSVDNAKPGDVTATSAQGRLHALTTPGPCRASCTSTS